MGTNVTIRPVTPDDLEWARNLRNKNRKFFFNSLSISKGQQRRWFQSLTYPFFVIEYEGKRAGTIAVKPLREGHEVSNVLIDARYRRYGILRQALAIVEATYAKPLYVDVRPDNAEALHAYERVGFTLFAHRLRKK